VAQGKSVLSEASHGTVHRHFVEYSKTGEACTNPMSTVLTWTQGLRHRAQLDDNAALAAFSDKLEQARADVVDAGTMTKDLASAIHKTSLQREHNVTSGEFVDAVALRVQGVLGLTL
jgi:isocitrate dehydrogenase